MQYHTFSSSMKEWAQEKKELAREFAVKRMLKEHDQEKERQKAQIFEHSIALGAQENKLYWKKKVKEFREDVHARVNKVRTWVFKQPKN